MSKPKILLWDIECSDLKADFGHILCIGYKWYGDDTSYVISMAENPEWPKPGKTLWDDKWMVQEFLPIVAEADDQVTWYGKKFDEPYVRSRMIHWGMRNDFPPIHHTDLWETCRKEFCLSNNRLITAGRFLRLEEGKIQMPVVDWKHASQGDRAAMARTERRCSSDVFMLEEAYEKMRPFIRVNRLNLSRVTGRDYACPACNSTNVQARGYRPTLAGRFRRWQCQDCGSWSSSPLKQNKGILR